MIPDHINPLQWHQAQGVARQACSRFFRDGCTPADAVRAFALDTGADVELDWVKAVDLIAEAICVEPARRAA